MENNQVSGIKLECLGCTEIKLLFYALQCSKHWLFGHDVLPLLGVVSAGFWVFFFGVVVGFTSGFNRSLSGFVWFLVAFHFAFDSAYGGLLSFSGWIINYGLIAPCISSFQHGCSRIVLGCFHCKTLFQLQKACSLSLLERPTCLWNHLPPAQLSNSFFLFSQILSHTFAS